MIKYHHYIVPRDKLNRFHHAGITIAYEYNKSTCLLSFAMAQCHKDDVYVKQRGRDLALDTYLNEGHITIYYRTTPYRKLSAFFNQMCFLIASTGFCHR